MSIQEAIEKAQLLLPGEPAAEGHEDVRWQAIIAVGEYVESEPQAVWDFIQTWGINGQEDLRDAIATCLLEHLLEYNFAEFFPQVEKLALSNPLFADTFLRCWKFGQSEEFDNSERFDNLSGQCSM